MTAAHRFEEEPVTPQLRSIQGEQQPGQGLGADAWLAGYDDKLLTCRMGHDWPDMIPNSVWERTTIEQAPPEVRGSRRGVYEITQHCGRCGRERRRLTTLRGLFDDGSSRWKYKDPSGYAQPPGMGIPRGDFVNEYWRRIMQTAKRRGFGNG